MLINGSSIGRVVYFIRTTQSTDAGYSGVFESKNVFRSEYAYIIIYWCTISDDDNFSELHHLLIESFLVFIIIGIVVVICVFRCQLLPDIVRRISPCTEPKSVAADEKIELSVMQPFMPQGKLKQVNAK